MLQIVIPAFNEERRLPRTLRELRRHVGEHRVTLGRVEVIVVDNASTDATAEVARAAHSDVLPVRVVSCERRGKGAAVRSGLLVTDSDLVCFMDADGATGLDAIASALRHIRGGADVVIGSRGLDLSQTAARHSRLRSAGASAYRRCTARLTPGIADTQCGFKVFRGDLVRRVARDLEAPGFAFDVELLVLLAGASARIVEMPVNWVDVPGSTFVPARHGAGAFAELARIAWRHRDLTTSELGRAGGMASSPTRRPAPLALPTALLVPLVVSTLVDLTGRKPR